MDIEMSSSSLEYAVHAASDDQTRAEFFQIMCGDDDTPSELYRSVTKMLEKYLEHLRNEAGDQWNHTHATIAASLWMSHAAFILAGLYAIYGRTFPHLRPGLVEKLEKDCDAPEKMLERETLLRSFGERGKKWMDAFMLATMGLESPSQICLHGVAYIYVLGTAFIHETENKEHLDPSIINAIEEILEEKKF